MCMCTAHFSLKKGKWVVSGVVVLCCLPFALFNSFSNIHVYIMYGKNAHRCTYI